MCEIGRRDFLLSRYLIIMASIGRLVRRSLLFLSLFFPNYGFWLLDTYFIHRWLITYWPFWGTIQKKDRWKKKPADFFTFLEERVQHCSVGLALGPQSFVGVLTLSLLLNILKLIETVIKSLALQYTYVNTAIDLHNMYRETSKTWKRVPTPVV